MSGWTEQALRSAPRRSTRHEWRSILNDSHLSASVNITSMEGHEPVPVLSWLASSLPKLQSQGAWYAGRFPPGPIAAGRTGRLVPLFAPEPGPSHTSTILFPTVRAHGTIYDRVRCNEEYGSEIVSAVHRFGERKKWKISTYVWV